MKKRKNRIQACLISFVRLIKEEMSPPAKAAIENQRITELQEVYEYGGMYVVPTMGDALPEKIDWSDK